MSISNEAPSTEESTALVLIVQQVNVLLCPTGRLQSYLDNARARNTITGYRSSFQQFQTWCQAAGLVAMPATDETVALYISAQAGRLKASTIGHHLAAIEKGHKAASFSSPTKGSILVKETLKGIKRAHVTESGQKSPVLTEDLRVMLRLLSNSMQGTRDRTLLLVGFGGPSGDLNLWRRLAGSKPLPCTWPKCATLRSGDQVGAFTFDNWHL